VKQSNVFSCNNDIDIQLKEEIKVALGYEKIINDNVLVKDEDKKNRNQKVKSKDLSHLIRTSNVKKIKILIMIMMKKKRNGSMKRKKMII